MADEELTPEEQTLLDDSKADVEDTEAPVSEEKPAEIVADEDEDEAPETIAVVEPEKEKKFVPLQALDSERHARRTVEQELAALQDEIKALRAPPPAPAAPEKMPDPVVEPDKFEQWLISRDQRLSQPTIQMEAQARQQEQQRQQMAALRGYAERHETAFRDEHKDGDYDGAVTFMREREARKFEIMGYNKAEIPNLVTQAEIGVTALAAQRGQNPAALIYNLAIENGFTPKQAKAAVDEAEKVTRLADVQAKTRSTAGVGGSPRQEEHSVADLASMSEKQLDALEKKDPEAFRKMIGG
jgi:hypothetical protein